MWRLNHMLLSNQKVIKERKNKKHQKQVKKKYDKAKSMGCTKSNSKRKVHSNAIPQETREIQNKQLHQKERKDKAQN